MARRGLILLEGSTTGLAPLFVRSAQRMGFYPITLSADPAQYAYIAKEGLEAVCVDTENPGALVRECSALKATYDVVGITSALGGFCATSAKLCRHFDLPGPNPESVERCCDKFAQRQLFAQAGVPIPAYRLAANATEVERAAAEIGLPVIVKPAVGTGSSGVRLCRNVDELAKHTTYLLGGGHIWPTSPRILVEEFAQGPHYCVDIMGNEVVGIAAAEFELPPHFVFREYIQPASLGYDEWERIADLSLSCLRALGLGWGPTNIEFRWTKRGPIVVEVNPRLGEDARLIRLAYGVDLISEHINLVTGGECDLRKRHFYTAAARYLNPDHDGILDRIDGDSQAAAVPGVAEVKFYVKPMTPIVRKGDWRDTIGHVFAASPSPALTAAILRRAVDLIDWSITPSQTEQEQSAVRSLSPPEVRLGKA